MVLEKVPGYDHKLDLKPPGQFHDPARRLQPHLPGILGLVPQEGELRSQLPVGRMNEAYHQQPPPFRKQNLTVQPE
jgi:hypothetical protein